MFQLEVFGNIFGLLSALGFVVALFGFFSIHEIGGGGLVMLLIGMLFGFTSAVASWGCTNEEYRMKEQIIREAKEAATNKTPITSNPYKEDTEKKIWYDAYLGIEDKDEEEKEAESPEEKKSDATPIKDDGGQTPKKEEDKTNKG